MGKLGVLFFLSFIFCLSSQAQSFEELSYRHRYELEEAFFKLYILQGKNIFEPSAETSGLLSEQKEKLFYLSHLYSADEGSYKKQLSSLFDFSREIKVWMNSFYFYIEENPQIIEKAYEQFRQQLPNQSFRQVLEYLFFQIDRQLYRLRFPLFAYHQIYPGATASDLEFILSLLELTDEERSRIQKKVQDFEVLSFDDYLKVSPAASFASSTQQRQMYESYVIFGSINCENIALPQELKKHLIEQGAGLENFDFYEELLSQSRQLNFELDWSQTKKWESTDEVLLLGFEWLHRNHLEEDQQIPEEFKNSSAQAVDFARWYGQVDHWFLQSFQFKEIEKQYYKQSLLLLKSEKWFETPPKDHPFWRAPTEIQNIIVARQFPDLPVSFARHLLLSDLLELGLQKISMNASSIFRDYRSHIEFVEWQQELQLRTPEDRKRLHQKLLKLYFEQRPFLKPENSRSAKTESGVVELLNGKVFSTKAKDKNKMRDFLEKHPEVLKDFIFPQIAEWLMIELFSSDQVFSWEKFHQELKRSRQYRKLVSQNPSLENNQKLAHLMRSPSGRSRMDASAPEFYLANLWGGITQSSAGELALAAGLGAGTYILFRGLGTKWFLRLILLDGGIRIGAAWYYDTEDRAFYELPVDQLFPTPGQFALESIQELFQIQRLVSANEAADKLLGYGRLGFMGSQWAAFGFGAASLHQIGGRSIFRLHSLHRRGAQLQKIRQNILQREARIKRLKTEVDRLKATQIDQKLSRYKSNKLVELEQRLAGLEHGMASFHLNSVRFLLFRGFRSVVQFGNRLMLFIPTKSPKLTWKQRLRSWRKNSSAGLARLEGLEQKVVKKRSQAQRNALQNKIPNYRQNHRAVRTELRKIESRWKRLQTRNLNKNSSQKNVTRAAQDLESLLKSYGHLMNRLKQMQKDMISSPHFRTNSLHSAKLDQAWFLQDQIRRFERELLEIDHYWRNGSVPFNPKIQKRITSLNQHFSKWRDDALEQLGAVVSKSKLASSPIPHRLQNALTGRSQFYATKAEWEAWHQTQKNQVQKLSPDSLPSPLRAKNKTYTRYALKNDYEIYWDGNTELILGRHVNSRWRFRQRFELLR